MSKEYFYPNFLSEILEKFKEPYYSFYVKMIEDLNLMDFSNIKYTEKHHIIPKCYNGSNKKGNIIKIPPEYHFYLHYFLFKGINDQSMTYAFHRMLCSKQNGKKDWLAPEDYGELKRNYSQIRSDYMKNRVPLSGKNHPNYGKHLTDRERQYLSMINSGKNNPMYGKKGKESPTYGKICSEETKKKISEAQKGKKHHSYGKTISEETKQKLSDAKKGDKNPFYNKKHTEYSKQKMREAKIGKSLSDEHKNKIAKSNKNKNAKKVLCIETGEIFESIQQAAKIKGIKSFSHITSVCRNNQKTCGGFHWKYYVEPID